LLEQRPISEIVAIDLEQVKDADGDRMRGHGDSRSDFHPTVSGMVILESVERWL
jgi:hypothetical protein